MNLFRCNNKDVVVQIDKPLSSRYRKNICYFLLSEFGLGLFFLIGAVMAQEMKSKSVFFSLLGASIFLFLNTFVTMIIVNFDEKTFFRLGECLEKFRTTLFCTEQKQQEEITLLKRQLFNLQQ